VGNHKTHIDFTISQHFKPHNGRNPQTNINFPIPRFLKLKTHEFHRCPLTSLTPLRVGAPFVIVERVHGVGETTFFSYSDGPIQYCSPLGISTAQSYSNYSDGKIKEGDGIV